MSTAPTTPTTRRLIVREGDVCWLYPDGSHRCVTQADADEINGLLGQVKRDPTPDMPLDPSGFS